MMGYMQRDKQKLIEQIDDELKNKDQELLGLPYLGQF